jgi:glutamyl-tRNA(Gln) amidotransferase subunit E
MTQKLDYKKLGLKCGIEIHQQLDTHKLFCSCPSVIRDDEPDVIVERKLKAVVGETGEIDSAAAYEAKRKKKIIYHGYSDTTCPIEFDEEPPRQMNKESLKIVLQVCKLMNAKIADEIQVMRKTVVDGSNTSGFQRTALVGYDALLKTELGDVRVPTLIIEEDAGKIVEQDSKTAIYNLSRLGIPLIEIGTDPDIKTPEHARDVALKIGLILRSTGKVKRGLGTIRQDLNVSIKEGNRVEIKGAQDLKMVPLWIENEIQRQVSLVEIRDELKKRKAKVHSKMIDLSDIFDNSECNIIRSGIKKGGVVKGIRLEQFEGLIGKEVQPNKRFGTEISDYAKVHSGVKGLFHSDEKLEKYKLNPSEIMEIQDRLGCKKGDSFIIISDLCEQVDLALEGAIKRIELAFNEVPKEVRRANPDGTSTFMRPMPGAARMYPETDCLPISTKELIKNIILPELIEDKEKRYQKEYSLSKDLSVLVSRFDYSIFDEIDSFDDLVKKFNNVKSVFLAESLTVIPKELKKKNNIEINNIFFKHEFSLLQKLNDSEITKGVFSELLVEMCSGKNVDFSKYKSVSDDEVEAEIKKIISENKDAPFGALMGIAMSKYRGIVDGKKISELLKKNYK